jgi:hypothetical protein
MVSNLLEQKKIVHGFKLGGSKKYFMVSNWVEQKIVHGFKLVGAKNGDSF